MRIGSKETPQMLEWFNIYLKMGYDRSLAKLSQVTNKSRVYLGGVSTKFGWQDRLDKIERDISEKSIELTKEALAEAKARKLRIIKAIDGRFAQKLQADKVDLSAGDFEKAARLELLVRGEADQRVGMEGATLIDVMKRAYERRRAKKSK